MAEQAIYHMNVATGESVKGVECRNCGEYVGLVKSKRGKWYTCQLVASVNPDSSAKRAYPFLPHFRVCRGIRGEYRVSWGALSMERWEGLADNADDARAKAGITFDTPGQHVERIVRGK
jgi:hypothetical protein